MNKKLLKKTGYICLFALCFAALARLCRLQTDGFAIYKICSELPYNEEFATTPLSPEERADIHKVLSQPYHYLGKGAQCFVFVSDDDQYVIKFFKQHNLRVPYFYRVLPLFGSMKAMRDEKIKEKQEDLYRDFLSYQLAYDLLKEETGLVFLHLNKTKDLGIDLTLYDKIHCIHKLPLDEMEFFVQRKASLFYEGLSELIVKGEKQKVKQRLTELVDLMAHRSMMGLYDKDPDINTNFGISGGKTVQIDVGRFRLDETRKDRSIAIEDILRATDNLKQWLASQDEELSEHLIETIDKMR